MAFSVARLGVWLLGVAGVSGVASAAGLSARLSADDIRDAGTTLSLGSMHRAWTAPAVANDDLGLDVGIETTFLFRGKLLTQGDNTAIMPRVIPMPRVWAMWDLPADFQVSASFAPGMLFDGIAAAGAGVQWAFAHAPDINSVFTVLGTYAYSDAFGDLRANSFEGAVQASRDLGAWQPYAGFGLKGGFVSVRDSLAAPDVRSGSYFRPAMHFYFGARVDLMAKLSLQLDFTNSHVSVAGLMSTSF